MNLGKHYSLFGGKGDVFNNSVHIYRHGCPRTLCGTPMLSTNYAKTDLTGGQFGCKDCASIYSERDVTDEKVIGDASQIKPKQITVKMVHEIGKKIAAFSEHLTDEGVAVSLDFFAAAITEIIMFGLLDNVPQMRPDFHNHKCEKCSHIWGHTIAEMKVQDEPHDCPQCGTTQTTKHYENEFEQMLHIVQRQRIRERMQMDYGVVGDLFCDMGRAKEDGGDM